MFKYISSPLTLGIIGLVGGCIAKQETQTNQIVDNHLCDTGNTTKLKNICMNIHKVGFSNGWKDHPRTLTTCKQRLEDAIQFAQNTNIKGDFLKTFSQCLYQNQKEQAK